MPSQRSNLVEVPDFADSPPRLEAVQDAVQVILERDLLTLEEDINLLEHVIQSQVHIKTVEDIEDIQVKFKIEGRKSYQYEYLKLSKDNSEHKCDL